MRVPRRHPVLFGMMLSLARRSTGELVNPSMTLQKADLLTSFRNFVHNLELNGEFRSASSTTMTIEYQQEYKHVPAACFQPLHLCASPCPARMADS